MNTTHTTTRAHMNYSESGGGVLAHYFYDPGPDAEFTAAGTDVREVSVESAWGIRDRLSVDKATSLRIVGYVQRSKAPKKFEVPLSLQRAQAVADYLTREMGKYVGKKGTVPEITVVRGGLPSSWAGKPTARRADVFATF